MDFKSGLFRLWAVASGAWVLFIAALFYQAWPTNRWALISLTGEPGGFGWEIMAHLQILGAGLGGVNPWLYALWAVGIPVVLLVAGHGVAWIVRGFRQAK